MPAKLLIKIATDNCSIDINVFQGDQRNITYQFLIIHLMFSAQTDNYMVDCIRMVIFIDFHWKECFQKL